MSNWTLADIEKSKAGKLNSAMPKQLTAQEMYQALGRMKARKMNKTEQAYGVYLQQRKERGEVLWFAFECINLRIAYNTYYRVDWLVLLGDGRLEAHENKGYWTDDALVKIKVAADIFPFKFRSFILKKGVWEEREF